MLKRSRRSNLEISHEKSSRTPGGSFEVLFRAYAPTKTFFDKTWRLADIVQLEETTGRR
jgi:hypothetical protein